MGDVA